MAPTALLTPPDTPNPSSPISKPSFLPSAQLHHAATPPTAVAAQGIYFTLSDGSTLIDGVGGAAVATLGMGNQEVVDAMTAQASQMGFAYHQILNNEPAEKLSRFLVDRSCGAFEAAAFLNSGTCTSE